MDAKQKRQLITQTTTAIKRGYVSLIELRHYAHHVAYAPGKTYLRGKVTSNPGVPQTAYIN